MASERPCKSLPTESTTAALSWTLVDGRQLSKPQRQVEDSSAPGAQHRESGHGSDYPPCAQGQLLRSLLTRAEGLLASAGRWGFDTLELAEVRIKPL